MKQIIVLNALFILLATTFVVAGKFVHTIAPFFGVGVRMLIAAGLMFTYLGWKRQLRIKRADAWLFVLMGVIHIAIPYAGEFWSLVYLSPTKVTFIWNLAPFMTALTALMLFGKRVRWHQWLGMIVGFIGFAPMLRASNSGQVFTGLFNIGVPEVLLLASVASSAVAWLVFQRLLERGYSPLVINAIAMGQGGLWCLGLSRLIEPWSEGLVFNLPLALLYMAFLIVAANFVCYNLYGRMLRVYSATFLAFASQLIAFYTALISWCLGDAFLTWHFWVSFAVVACGLYIFCLPGVGKKITDTGEIEI